MKIVLQSCNFCSNLMSMSQDNLIQLKNKETGEVYFSRRNRKTATEKLELKKYSKKLRKPVIFKETKK
jgi:ribosomal protein L33